MPSAVSDARAGVVADSATAPKTAAIDKDLEFIHVLMRCALRCRATLV